MTYTFDEYLISDLHKDAYGFRPTSSFWSAFAAFNPDQKQALWDSLLVALKRSVDEDYEREQLDIFEFEDRIDNLMHDGTNRKAIVEWLMGEADCKADAEGFDTYEFTSGLPFGYLKKMGYV